MFKYKKYSIYFITISYIILSLIEFIKYFFINSNLFGLIYLLVNIFILFLLVPTTYNYNKYYSPVRLSKLIIIILIGIFNSYILNIIVLNSMSYVDSSIDYIDSIFVIKNILKGVLYALLIVFTLLEFKLDRLIVKKISKKG